MDKQFKCSTCDFEFNSGWSHHEWGAPLVCTNCACKFKVISEKSPWGPSPDEVLPVYRRSNKKKPKRNGGSVFQPTGLTIIGRDSPTVIDGKTVHFVQVSPASLTCPQCNSAGTIVSSFVAGESCPKCHKGKVVDLGEVEY